MQESCIECVSAFLISLVQLFTRLAKLIGHFRVPLNLSFKASLSAKRLLW